MTSVRSTVALAALLAAGCSSSAKKADAGAPNLNCGGATKACLTGTVTTAATADDAFPVAVPGATISLPDGTLLGTANDQGWYFVRNVPAGPSVSICYEAASYARRCRNVTAAGGQNVQVANTGLLGRAVAAGAIDPSVGGTIDLATATQIGFPPNGACLAAGGTPVGTVACSLTPIIAKDQAQLSASPGSFQGKQTSGTQSQLVTGGMIEIVCSDSNSAKVNVCAGKTATIRFPVDGASCADTTLHPVTMKSWGYDEVTGVWQEYGTFFKTCGTDSTDSYYEGAVNHFSYWNADDPIQTTCASGRVLDNAGSPVLGALVRCDGTSGALDGYQGPSEAYSDATGAFCVPVKRNSSFDCIARKGAFVSAAKTALHSADNTNACGASCTAMGDFTLADPLGRIVLTWGATPADLDSHFVGADYLNGTNVWYSSLGSLTEPPFVELDTDDISSYGPEITSFVHGATAQRYRFCVHNYSGYYPGPPVESLPTSGAVVDAFLGGGHLQIAVPTTPTQNDVWRVLQFNLDGNGNATGIQVLNDIVDSNAAGSVEAACMQ